jgi:RNA polymerase sigma factor (sigma-70 family)
MEMENQKKSVDRFFRNEYKKLVRFVRMNLDDRYYDASPEDIVQDVVLSLVSRLDPNVQIGNLTGYIYRSLKNRIIDNRKKKQRMVSMENFRDRKNENYLLDNVADETLTDEPDYKNLEPELLHQAIAQLRPDEQAVIIATEFEQHTFEELSEEWEIPLGTLLSRKHRAVSKLYKILLNNK